MNIGIHHNPSSFSGQWIDYCKKIITDYELANGSNNIVDRLKECEVGIWHHHADFKDTIAAKKLVAFEHAEIKLFPDFKTGWYFDDKVVQNI